TVNATPIDERMARTQPVDFEQCSVCRLVRVIDKHSLRVRWIDRYFAMECAGIQEFNGQVPRTQHKLGLVRQCVGKADCPTECSLLGQIERIYDQRKTCREGFQERLYRFVDICLCIKGRERAIQLIVNCCREQFPKAFKRIAWRRKRHEERSTCS